MAEQVDLFSKKALTANEDLVALAGLCEKVERYEDMVKVCLVMLEKQDKEKEMHDTTRNLISVAFKNVVGQMRSSVRTLEQHINEQDNMDDATKKHQQAYKNLAQSRCVKQCKDILTKLSQTVCAKLAQDPKVIADMKPKEPIADNGTFWLKLLGDYMRYLTEMNRKEEVTLQFGDGEEQTFTCVEWAGKFYESATAWATAGLSVTDKTRLGLALNYSVFFYEVAEKKDEAVKLARAAFDEAIKELNTLNDSSYKDSTLIMQLLRDNLTLWDQGAAEDEAPPDN